MSRAEMDDDIIILRYEARRSFSGTGSHFIVKYMHKITGRSRCATVYMPEEKEPVEHLLISLQRLHDIIRDDVITCDWTEAPEEDDDE